MEKVPKKMWFRAKTYGYGWTPCSIEGWLVMLLYVWSCMNIFLVIDWRSHSSSDTLINFAPVFLAQTFLLYVICVWRGEKARWRWGREK